MSTVLARTSAKASTRGGAALIGVRPLLKVSLRQDVRNIAPWVILTSVLSASSILAYAWIFPDPQDRAALAANLGASPALSLVFGPARDLTTGDGFNAWRAGQLGAFFAGLMAALIVVRNSRANEDSGQAELIASGVVARSSRLAVAVAMAAIASVVLGVVCFLVTLACGGGVTATLILSATFTASGLMFAGVAAVAAQLGSDARTASSIAVAALGICYVLRGYIDSSGAPDWVTWLTPLGWLEAARPATNGRRLTVGASVTFDRSLRPWTNRFGLQSSSVSRRPLGPARVAGQSGPCRCRSGTRPCTRSGIRAWRHW